MGYALGEGEGFVGVALEGVGGEGGGLREGEEPDVVEGGGVGDVGEVWFGGAGFDAPGAVAEVEDAVGVGVVVEEGVGPFVGVVVVLEGSRDGVFFEEGDPGVAEECGGGAIIAVVGGVGGDVIDGDEDGDVVSGVEGGLEPEGLFPFDGVVVVCVEEEEGAVCAEVEGAVGEGFVGKGHEVEEEGA